MSKQKKYYVAIGAIVKNESDYIEEWIDYHLKLGVELFYIFDNDSTDNTCQKLKKYIDLNIVKLYKIRGKNQQMKAYNKIIHKAKKESYWVAFIDVDEYIYINPKLFDDYKNIDIKRILKCYEEENGIGINWLLIGPSGHIEKPKGGVIDNYNQCLPKDHYKNLHIKSIVNIQYAKKFGCHPHACSYRKNGYAVNEDKQLIKGNVNMAEGEYSLAFTNKHSSNKIALFHYYTKSKHEFYLRSMKGKASGEWDAKRVYDQGIAVFDDCSDCWENNDLKRLNRLLNNKDEKYV